MLKNSPKRKEPVLPLERNEFVTHTNKINFLRTFIEGFKTFESAQEYFMKIANQKNLEDNKKKLYLRKVARIHEAYKEMVSADKFFDKVIADDRFISSYK